MWWIIAIIVVIIIAGFFGVKESNGRERQIKEVKQQQNQEIQDEGITVSAEYEWTDSVMHKRYYRFIADDKAKMIYICRGIVPSLDKLPYDLISGFEVLADSKVVGGIKRAVVGGVLAGGAGAIVGAVTAQKKAITSFKAVFYLEDVHNPTYELSFFDTTVKTDSVDFKSAAAFTENINVTIKAILSRAKREVDTAIKNIDATTSSVAKVKKVSVSGSTDDLTNKLKQLKAAYEAEIITAEEYEAKKAEILSRI